MPMKHNISENSKWCQANRVGRGAEVPRGAFFQTRAAPANTSAPPMRHAGKAKNKCHEGGAPVFGRRRATSK